MTPLDAHPSFLELDRASLGPGAPQTLQHIESCPRCQAHLRAVQSSLPMPGWASELRVQRTAWKPWLLWSVSSGLVAVAMLLSMVDLASPGIPALLHFWRASKSTEHPPLLAAKGSPAVAVYVKRADQVFLWDGHAPMHPGDRLQLEITAAGFAWVAVGEGGDPISELVYSAPIDRMRPVLLPQSLLVDSKPGTERLILGLSVKELSAQGLSNAAKAHRRDDVVWTTELFLPKDTAEGHQP